MTDTAGAIVKATPEIHIAYFGGKFTDRSSGWSFLDSSISRCDRLAQRAAGSNQDFFNFNNHGSMQMMRLSRSLATMALLAGSTPSWAGYIGHTVGLTWEDVPRVAVLPGEPPPTPSITDFGTGVVGAGIEFSGAAGYDIDVSDNSIRLLASCLFCGSPWNDSLFSGFRIRDADGSLPPITGVSIALDSHLGIDPWRISYDSDSIQINLAGLEFDSGYRYVFSDSCEDAPPGFCMVIGHWEQIFQPELRLDISFSQVPEPNPLAMIGLGMAALICTRRTQKPAGQRQG